MARGFGGTALRAALGAVTGVAEGMRLREEREFEREKEKAAAARQAMLDAAALRREEREVASTMIPAERFASMTMPGATSMQAALRQTIGGKEYVYAPQVNAAEKHRADVMKERGERQEKSAALEAALDAGEQAGFNRNKLRAVLTAPASVQGVMAARAFPAPERPRDADLSDEEKEMIGRQFISAQAKNPALTRALSTTFAQNPALAETPGIAAYNIMKRGTVPKVSAMTEYKPPKPEKDSGDDLAALIREGEQRKAGQRGGAATPTPQATTPAGPAAPAGADPERYRTDANYRQWVDSQLRG